MTGWIVRSGLRLAAAVLVAAVAVIVLFNGDAPGHEVEFPLAVVILGGLATSLPLTLFVLPSLYLRFGHSHGTGVLGAE